MANPQAEPSMEEILASIRRIISEDDEDASAKNEPVKAEPARAQAAQPAPQPSASAEKAEKKAEKPAPQPRAVDTQAVIETVKRQVPEEVVEMTKKNAKKAIQEGGDAMLDKNSAEAATQAFQALSQTVRVSEGQGRTVEDIVVEMLQPMIKDWLDANLPAIVEEKVEEEVQRVSRRRA